MARIKLAYIGGGSTRGAGTMASLIQQGVDFDGSEVVLVDLDPETARAGASAGRADGQGPGSRHHGDARRRTAGRASRTATPSSRASGPGGFAARVLDERIPLRHGVIGQETQGPGGFFMALRAVHVLQRVLADIEQVCPRARVFNYTNPVNILAQAVTQHSDVSFVSLCEGPIYYRDQIARSAELDHTSSTPSWSGLNHASWSVRHLYGARTRFP